MTGFKEYDKYDGLGLADLFRRKEISPAELCGEAISRIERLNPRINAVITPMYDLARKAAQKPLPEGPFTGVPFLLKDALDDFAGVPLTMGSNACRNYVPNQDSEMVRRFKKAGLVILGKTNIPEFGLSEVTEPEAFGPTRNPWNLDHSPGGSSGGSAAAVASGMVPMASGNDGGGSIRIPASCCGLFGLKPSRGRTPLDPEMEEMWQGHSACFFSHLQHVKFKRQGVTFLSRELFSALYSGVSSIEGFENGQKVTSIFSDTVGSGGQCHEVYQISLRLLSDSCFFHPRLLRVR